MASAFDGATVTVVQYSGASSFSVNHTAAAGSNRCAVLDLGWSNGAGDTITATYGGTNMVLEVSQASADDQRSSIYTHLAPATSATAVAVTWTGTAAAYGASGITSYNGVDQTDPVSNFNSATAASGIPTVTVTTAADEILVDACKCYNGGGGMSGPGANQTQRFNSHDGTYFELSVGSTQLGSDGGVMSWATSLSNGWAITAVSLKAAAAAGGFAYSQGHVMG